MDYQSPSVQRGGGEVCGANVGVGKALGPSGRLVNWLSQLCRNVLDGLATLGFCSILCIGSWDGGVPSSGCRRRRCAVGGGGAGRTRSLWTAWGWPGDTGEGPAHSHRRRSAIRCAWDCLERIKQNGREPLHRRGWGDPHRSSFLGESEHPLWQKGAASWLSQVGSREAVLN
jgi:hypothetical protein